MRAIDKFILHVVHNWRNELNEAYSENAIKGFIKRFQEEADDLNIQITDDQLRAYINTFDRIKEKLPNDQRDLNKWSVAKFIRLVTATKGDEGAEEIDITPDVVYHNDENTIVIYNGSKQDNCVRYGNGEQWCITRSSFPNYRYSDYRSYPTFYLAKNNNLSDSDPLSFVAIQVRDPKTTREDNRYVYTNRKNSPHESSPMSFEELLSEVPWLREVPNIKSILKYIPISSSEKVTQQYRSSNIAYREWTKFPFSVKQQYLVVRKGNKLFSDIDDEEFVEKYLPKYPELAKFIAETPGVIDSVTLLKSLDKFPNQIRRSITANIQDKIPVRYISQEIFPFDVKKLLVQLNKWDIKPDERLYINKEGDTIVKLELGDDIKIGLYQAEDDFPNIKLNKRTSKYLLEYPELDKIPLRNLLKLAQDEVVDKSLITKVLDNAKKDENSALIIKPVEDGEIVLDSNSFSSYKVGTDGKITSVPFDNEEVQQAFTDAKDNESFQQNALNLFKSDRNIPATIDKDALISVINATPYNQRIVQFDDTDIPPSVVLTAPDGNLAFILMPATFNPRQQRSIAEYGRRGNDWRQRDVQNNLTANEWRAYFAYLRATNQSLSDSDLTTMLGNSGFTMSGESKRGFISSNPPVVETNRYKPTMNGDEALLINTADPRSSFKISATGKLVKANVPSALARQLLGGQQAAAPGAGNVIAPGGRRGRPAGVPNAPQAAAQPAAAPGNINVPEVMDEIGLQTAFMRMPRADYRKLAVANGSRVDPNGDRGAARRNNQLGNRGRVGRIISLPGGSKIYFIRLANQQVVASINIQPGNRNYLLTGNANGNVALSLNSPSELLQALQQRNLAEIHQYLVNEYLGANPTHLSEFRQLLRKHINEKNEQE
jgi:hypothetical protein